jgi:hypothetical protein
MAIIPAASMPPELDLLNEQILDSTTTQKDPSGSEAVATFNPGPPTIHTVGDIAANSAMLHDLVSVINTAYRIHSNFGNRDRFENDQQLVD